MHTTSLLAKKQKSPIRSCLNLSLAFLAAQHTSWSTSSFTNFSGVSRETCSRPSTWWRLAASSWLAGFLVLFKGIGGAFYAFQRDGKGPNSAGESEWIVMFRQSQGVSSDSGRNGVKCSCYLNKIIYMTFMSALRIGMSLFSQRTCASRISRTAAPPEESKQNGGGRLQGLWSCDEV